MQTLLARLDDLMFDTSIGIYEFLPLAHPLVAEISARAEWLLITKKGKCDYENIAVLESRGYRAFPVESTLAGWYLGGIWTPKGVITYG